MCSDAFKPRPVKDSEGNEVPGLMEIDSEKINKVRHPRAKLLEENPPQREPPFVTEVSHLVSDVSFKLQVDIHC